MVQIQVKAVMRHLEAAKGMVDGDCEVTPSHVSQEILSRLRGFKIIDSTLREGEQFANMFLDTAAKIQIAKALDDFGVDYIEVTNPASSEQSYRDCVILSQLNLKKSKIIAHTRCHMDDVRRAIAAKVDAVSVVMGTSSQLRTHSHGQDLESIKKRAVEVVEFVRSQGLEVRFSTEDTFRSSLNDLLDIYTAVDRAGADRIGIADTVGCATPRQTYHTVELLRRRLRCGIEAHFHNDTGGAISNAFCALEAGATHIDTCVLGIGERNGITPLGGLIARMITVCRESVVPRYRVSNLLRLEQLVADIANISIPFNNYVTGPSVFHHKAGIHAKAVLRDATTYEILRPEDFGLKRHVDFASRLTGWNSIKYRAQQLGMHVPDEVYRLCATDVKSAADTKRLSNEEADSIIRHRCSSWLDNKALRVN